MTKNNALPALSAHNFAWTDAFHSMGYGILIFSDKKKLEHFTQLGIDLLNTLWPVDPEKLSYNDIVEKSFEYALDISSLPELVRPTFTDMRVHNEGLTDILKGPRNEYILIRVTPLDHTHIMVMVENITHMIAPYTDDRDLTWQHHILLQAIEQGPMGIGLFDPRDIHAPIIFTNTAFCQMINVPREGILGKNWKVFFPDTDDEGLYHVIHRHIDENQRTYGVHISTDTNLGMIFLSDITETQKKEDQLLHMQKLESLGQLAGGVAHDFNNIMGIINGYAHLLKGWTVDDTRAGPAVSSILNACQRGASLSNKLLTFSRAGSSSQNICTLQLVLQQLKELLHPLLPKNVYFEIFAPAHDVYVKCSEDHLMQIFMNLVINARDAMQDGGHITIDCSTPSNSDDKITFTIRDNGCGIPPEIISQIYEPFFTTKPVGKGTGLGLSVIYGLIQQNKGHIDVVSNIGRGTMFVIDLPILVDDDTMPHEAHIPTQRDVTAPLSLENMTVLIVDDEPDMQQTLGLFFEDLKATVIKTSSGESALEIQDEYDQKIDILVTDLRMPGIYGDDLARMWRGIRPDTKIIIVSGYTENRDINTQYYDLLLAKPIDYNRMSSFLLDSLSVP